MNLSEKGRDLIFAATNSYFTYGGAFERNWINGEDADAENAQAKLIAYIAVLESARAWRPIETAPRNDLFLGTDGDIVEISSWSMDPGIAHYYSGSYEDPISYRPTNWMPIPEAPK